MVDWNSPQTLLLNSLTLVKLLHVVDGIYIWEYFTTLWFEWEVLTKRRPWRRTMLIYFATRITALAGVCTELVGFNLTTRFNCQAWLLAVLITVYPAFALNSLLILLRTIAIWERKLIISVALTAVWLTNVAFLIHGITLAEGVWLPLQNACFVANSQKAKLNVLVSTITDLVLLLAMIIGVLRLESDSSIWRMLYRHGIVWIVLATIGLVPPTIFLFLNLNEPMNLMFQTPGLVIMFGGFFVLSRSDLLTVFLPQDNLRDPSLPLVSDLWTSINSLVLILSSPAPLWRPSKPLPRSVRFQRNSSGGTQSLSTNSGPTGTSASLEVEFPTSYGRYRAEDLELVNDRLKAINEEGEDFRGENVKAKQAL
ncbi:hypothetical protein EDB85DRAFT_2144336 [Lactarius pseudohatsudake]|nr:hypothetical protein EDB85DRAFT_2144336 [Lactarius pseudohatsudake]